MSSGFDFEKYAWLWYTYVLRTYVYHSHIKVKEKLTGRPGLSAPIPLILFCS